MRTNKLFSEWFLVTRFRENYSKFLFIDFFKNNQSKLWKQDSLFEPQQIWLHFNAAVNH